MKHWLSGLVRCSACGSTLIFAKPHYFKCNSYIRGSCSHSQHVKADILAEAVIARMAEDAYGSTCVSYDVTCTSASAGGGLRELEAALKLLRAKKGRLQEAYLAGVFDLADFASAKQSLDANIAHTEKELAARRAMLAQDAVVPALRSSIAAALETLRSPETTIEEKNMAARSILETCVFDKKSSTLAITYRMMF